MSSEPLLWSLPPPYHALGALPVTLISETGEVVARGISGQPFTAPDIHGFYFLSVRLPNGRGVIGTERVEVGAGPLVLPTLARELARHLNIEEFSGVPMRSTAIQQSDDSAVTLESTQALPWAVYHMRGELIDALGQGAGIGRPLQWCLPHMLMAGRHNLVRISQVDQALIFVTEESARMVVLPFDQLVDQTPMPAESIVLELQSENGRPNFLSSVSTATNAYIKYVDRGLMAESIDLSSIFLNDTSTSSSASKSLLGIIVSAYVLLRANSLEQLEQALETIARYADEAPDYWAILAELRARKGQHVDAIDALIEGTKKRCPWFRSGLSYQLQRLTVYLGADADDQAFELPAHTRRVFAQHRYSLQAMAERLDPRELLTTFMLEAGEINEIKPPRLEASFVDEIELNLGNFDSDAESIWVNIVEELSR